MTAREKGFKFHAQPQTGAYSCLFWTNTQFLRILSNNMFDKRWYETESPLSLELSTRIWVSCCSLLSSSYPDRASS